MTLGLTNETNVALEQYDLDINLITIPEQLQILITVYEIHFNEVI